jgi:hypothetical protein
MGTCANCKKKHIPNYKPNGKKEKTAKELKEFTTVTKEEVFEKTSIIFQSQVKGHDKLVKEDNTGINNQLS